MPSAGFVVRALPHNRVSAVFFWMFMEILFLLIPISVVLIVAAVCAFYWAVRSRQFDDLESPGMIPLLDDSEEERRQREDASQ